MSEQEPISEYSGGMSSVSNENTLGPDNFPTVLHDPRGRILWRSPGNNPEENLRIGIRNMQSMVISAVPELKDIPRDENGQIEDSQKPSIESLIWERIRNNEAIQGLNKSDSGVVYPLDYKQFRTSLRFGVAASFADWGLFEADLIQIREKARELKNAQEKQELGAPESLTLVKDDERTIVRPINQREGREKLGQIIKGEVSPEDVPPIYVTDLRKRKTENSSTFYIGKGYRDISFGEKVTKEFEDSGEVLLIPREDKRFGYKWVEVYGIKEGIVNVDSNLNSLRVNQQKGAIEVFGWYGPEKQPFLDYISGRLSVSDPSELPSFTEENQVNGIYLARIDGKNLQIPIRVPSSIKKVRMVPQHDPHYGYSWLEGYDAEKNDQQVVLSTRIITNKTEKGWNAKFVDWKGPQIQAMSDWIKGRFPTSMMGEIQAMVDSDNRMPIVSLGENLPILLKYSAFDREKPVYFLPKEKGQYKWIEVQQEDENNNRRTITLVRVATSLGSPILKRSWVGPERQAILDYVDGEVDSSQLEPFRGRLDNSKGVYVATRNDKGLKISLRSVGFNEGDEVELLPSVDEDGNLIIEVKKGDSETILARSVFNKTINQFNTTSLEPSLSPDRKHLGYWNVDLVRKLAQDFYDRFGDLSIELVEREMPELHLQSAVNSVKYPGGWTGLRKDVGAVQADEFGLITDEQGLQWAGASYIAQEAGVTIKVVQRILKDALVAKKDGRGINGKKMDIYSLQESLKLIRERPITTTSWFEMDPEKRIQYIEEEARKFFEQNGKLDQESLKASDYGWLVSGIGTYYPGKLLALREKLGIGEERHERGYWQNIFNIDEAARKLIASGGSLTKKGLKAAKLTSLGNATNKYYPGGMPALRAKLGVAEILRRPDDYWTPTTIESEAQEMLAQGIDLISNRMKDAGYGYLLSAINTKYPGNMATLRRKLSISYKRKAREWWNNIENIDLEIKKAIDAGIPLTSEGLRNANLSGLASAIFKYYPGKIRGAREKFGLEQPVKQVSPDEADELIRSFKMEEIYD